LPTTTESRAFIFTASNGTKSTRSIKGVIRVEWTTAGQLNVQLRANPDDNNAYKAYNGWTDSKSPTYSLTIDGTTYTGKWNFDWRNQTQTIVTTVSRNLTTTKTSINISGVLNGGKNDSGDPHPLGIATIPSTSFTTGITATTTTTTRATTTTTTRATTTTTTTKATTTTTTTQAPTPVFSDFTINPLSVLNVTYLGSDGFTESVAASSTNSYSVISAVSPPAGSLAGLPPGILLGSSSGRLTGAPTSLGTYTFRIRATSSAGKTADTANLTITVQPPVRRMTGATSSVQATTLKRFVGPNLSTTNASGQTIQADSSGYVDVSRVMRFNGTSWESVNPRT
jgi:hypothetical protein